MILLINTSTPVCEFILVDGTSQFEEVWEADRTLARNLLKRLLGFLESHGRGLSDLSGLGAFEGPGSFTGLRIGLTVLNTIADSEKIPIVGGRGDDWNSEIIDKLRDGQDDKIILPFYGSEARVTSPKK